MAAALYLPFWRRVQRPHIRSVLAEGQGLSVYSVSLCHVLSSPQKALRLVAAFLCVLGSSGISGQFQPDRTHFQNSVINSGISQGRRVLKVGQGKVCRDDQGLSGAASGVYDVEDLFHGIGRVPFDAQVVDDKKVISGQLVQEFPVYLRRSLEVCSGFGESSSRWRGLVCRSRRLLCNRPGRTFRSRRRHKNRIPILSAFISGQCST